MKFWPLYTDTHSWSVRFCSAAEAAAAAAEPATVRREIDGNDVEMAFWYLRA